MTNTPDLFQPTELEVAGPELDAVIASIESRGGLVQRLDVVSISGYRLAIVWPCNQDAAQGTAGGEAGENRKKTVTRAGYQEWHGVGERNDETQNQTV